MKKEFIGIDVSKATIDVSIYHHKSHNQFRNSSEGYKQMLQWVQQQTMLNVEDMAFCMEHTGIYSLRLSLYLTGKHICFFLVSGLAIKRTLGLKRGKNDQVDSANLARYAYLYREELKPYVMPSQAILDIKELFGLRLRMVRQRAGYKTQLKETARSQALITVLERNILFLNGEIEAIDKAMLTIIEANEDLKDTYRKLTSIRGVGIMVAAAMIVHTNNFKSFDQWRKFACYAGIAPFEHQSGTSIKGKTRISILGNRMLKTLLSTASASAIQNNPEMRIYYQRRLNEGKTKMATLNIIRNKLVSRMFAVARRTEPYIQIHKYAA